MLPVMEALVHRPAMDVMHDSTVQVHRVSTFLVRVSTSRVMTGHMPVGETVLDTFRTPMRMMQSGSTGVMLVNAMTVMSFVAMHTTTVVSRCTQTQMPANG